MRSIIDNRKRCYVCGTTLDLHKHHIIHGLSNRDKSEKLGLWVYLCAEHHNMSQYGVHNNRELDRELKELAQRKFEEQGGNRQEWMKMFHHNYL